MNTQLSHTFEELKGILNSYTKEMTIKKDTPEEFYLDGGLHPKSQEPIMFGKIFLKDDEVNYKFKPAELFPELLNDVSSDLKQNMDDNSIFHFKETNQNMVNELKDLTQKGYQRYKNLEYL
ncbi:MAG: hypothetical protein ACNS62_09560 [Candidatus Cyclobacteriaceae bacterium M3_2C_046]